MDRKKRADRTRVDTEADGRFRFPLQRFTRALHAEIECVALDIDKEGLPPGRCDRPRGCEEAEGRREHAVAGADANCSERELECIAPLATPIVHPAPM